MKLKFPKTLQIDEQLFHITYDKKAFDAEFAFADGKKNAKIRIGVGDLKACPTSVLMRIIHELKEIIHIQQATRYRRSDNNEYEFHYSHKEHTDMCARLAGLLTHFIK
jgi:hypothetical protein